MTKPDNVIEERTGASLSPDAKAKMLANMVMGWQNRMAFLASKKLINGMWVPGALYLTPTHIHFEADKLQTLSLKNPETLSWCMGLDEINTINVRPGLAYKINEIQTDGGALQTFRCWNSGTFLQAIDNVRLGL